VIFVATSEVDCAWDLVAPSGCISVPLYVTQEGTLIQELAWAYLPSTVDTHTETAAVYVLWVPTRNVDLLISFVSPPPRSATAPSGPGPPRY